MERKKSAIGFKKISSRMPRCWDVFRKKLPYLIPNNFFFKILENSEFTVF